MIGVGVIGYTDEKVFITLADADANVIYEDVAFHINIIEL